MKFGEVFKVYLHVISDWRVIVSIIGMIIFVSIAKSIANYKKRPKRPRVKKGAAAPSPAQPEKPSPEASEAE